VFRKVRTDSMIALFMEVRTVISMNDRRLPTFSPQTMRGGDLGFEYEPGTLEMHLAAKVILDVQSFMGSGRGSVYPLSREVVAPRIVEIVVAHLRAECGYPATYVLNDNIVVTETAVIHRTPEDVQLLQRQITEQDAGLAPTHS